MAVMSAQRILLSTENIIVSTEGKMQVMETAPDHVARIIDAWRRERPDLDPAPQGIIGRLHRLAAALTEQLVAVYRSHGLGEGEFDVLATLRRAGSPFERQPSELAHHTMVTSGA